MPETDHRLIVVSATSGTGKSAVCRRLLEKYPDLDVSISHTTRPPRGRERNGVEYYFVPDAVFDEMVRERKFLEWAVVHGQKYGTSNDEVRRIFASGKDVLLDIDVQGGLQIKKLHPDAQLVFLLPPDFEQLLARLRGRATENELQIARRLRTALDELDTCSRYEFFVVNDRLEDAVEKINSIRCGRGKDFSRLLPQVATLRESIGKFLARNGCAGGEKNN